MPRTALRSRISYGSAQSQFDLPPAYFDCPICGEQSASGTNNPLIPSVIQRFYSGPSTSRR